MKEIFPTNVQPGVRLTTGWVNDVGKMLNRLGAFRSGSTLGGFRSGAFDADIAQFRTHLRPFAVYGYEEQDSSGAAIGITTMPPSDIFTIQFQAINSTIYRGIMLRWNAMDNRFERDNDALELDDPLEFAPYRLTIDWTENQFVLPGDVVLAVYDEMRGDFVVTNPAMFRPATATVETFRGESEIFNIFGHFKPVRPDPPVATVYADSGVRVRADFQWGFENHEYLNPGDEVWLEYVWNLRSWVVVAGAVKHKAIFIEFELLEELTAESPSANARVDYFYQGDDPGDELRVYNPTAGCTGTTYRFHGPAGCKGQATRDERTNTYRIHQLDCPTS